MDFKRLAGDFAAAGAAVVGASPIRSSGMTSSATNMS